MGIAEALHNSSVSFILGSRQIGRKGYSLAVRSVTGNVN